MIDELGIFDDFPDSGCPIGTTSDDFFRIQRVDTLDFALVSKQGFCISHISQTPHFDGTVERSTEELTQVARASRGSTPAKGQARNSITVASEGANEGVAAGVPHVNEAVVATADTVLRVGGDGHRQHAALVAQRRRAISCEATLAIAFVGGGPFSRFHVPFDEAAVLGAGVGEGVVPAQCHAGDGQAVASE